MIALPQDELIALSDLNLAESLREFARWCPGSVIDERDDTLRTAGSTRFPAGTFNAVLCLDATPSDPDGWLREQQAFYAARDRGFSVYTRGERDRELAASCLAAGMARGGDPPGMVCEQRLADAPVDPRVTLRPVHNSADLSELVEVEAHAYVSLGLPENITRKVFSAPERLLRPQWLGVLASAGVDGEHGRASAAALLLFSHGVAGVYWVGTRPEARGRGLAEACTRWVTNRAFDCGARAVVLQASQGGEPIYRRMGFREITRYAWYVSFLQR